MIRIARRRLADGRHAETDGRTIWLDDRLSAVQMLCAFQHELIHIERGHTKHPGEESEMSVRYETARRLLPDIPQMAEGCADGDGLRDVADRLGVTRQVLMDRAVTLSDCEAEQLGCRDCMLCPAMRARYGSLVAQA